MRRIIAPALTVSPMNSLYDLLKTIVESELSAIRKQRPATAVRCHDTLNVGYNPETLS
jgi:hypothetical protein